MIKPLIIILALVGGAVVVSRARGILAEVAFAVAVLGWLVLR